MSLHANVMDQLRRLTEQPVEQGTLNNALRLLSKWRSVLIQNTLIQQEGLSVMQGPLAGLEFIAQSAEGCHVPKLLGCYEQPLQPYITQALSAGYELILNIGCAEGYYAVGMARRLANAQVLAHDLDENAQLRCKELAQKNGVADRVQVAGLFTPEDFARSVDKRTLVLCDIEGGEDALLDPTKAPALAGMDMIVESHECLVPGITKRLIDRFSATHEITLVHDDGQRQLDSPPVWFNNLAHLDQLLATWEWRSGPTPWLVMRSQSRS